MFLSFVIPLLLLFGMASADQYQANALDPTVEYSGKWVAMRQFCHNRFNSSATVTRGSSVKFSFFGTKIDVYGNWVEVGGISEVRLDGRDVGTWNSLTPSSGGRCTPVIYSSPPLPLVRHNVELEFVEYGPDGKIGALGISHFIWYDDAQLNTTDTVTTLPPSSISDSTILISTEPPSSTSLTEFTSTPPSTTSSTADFTSFPPSVSSRVTPTPTQSPVVATTSRAAGESLVLSSGRGSFVTIALPIVVAVLAGYAL